MATETSQPATDDEQADNYPSEYDEVAAFFDEFDGVSTRVETDASFSPNVYVDVTTAFNSNVSARVFHNIDERDDVEIIGGPVPVRRRDDLRHGVMVRLDVDVATQEVDR